MTAKKQHAWALLTPTAQSLLEPNIAQATGATVTVTGNDGNPCEVSELHGGFALIGAVNGWNMVIGCGMDFVFQSMVQQLQAVGVQVGSPVGVLLAIVDDLAGTEDPDYAQLDVAVPVESKAPIDAWLTTHQYSLSPDGSYRQVIEYVGGLFRHGFEVGQDSIY